MRLGAAIMMTIWLALAGGAVADTYPARTVRVLTGYPPGGAADVIGRVLVDALTASLGQPFYLEGKPGAAGNLAGDILANAPPDGYTLYLAGFGVVTINHALYGNMSYDPATAFAPITLLARLPLVLEVSAKLPVTSYQDFVAYVAKHPRLNYGSPGIGTPAHLTATRLAAKLGIQGAHVPYRGSGFLTPAMMKGEVDWGFDVPNAALTLLSANAIKALAVTSRTRSPIFPDVPSIAELGQADLVVEPWFALVAPARTPRAIVERIAGAVGETFGAPEAAARLRPLGYEPSPTSPDETAAIFAADRARWSAVVVEHHIKAE